MLSNWNVRPACLRPLLIPCATVTEIHKILNIEQSTTSHHLGILKDKGVLQSQREGKNTYYSLKHNSLKNIVECVSKCTVSQ
jgi:DNA-binding transcriptional ArsR family regulator